MGTDRADEALLRLPAPAYLPTDEAQIPTGRTAVAGTPYDFRRRRPIGTTRIDYAFTELERTEAGWAELTLENPTDGRRVVFWLDAAFPYLEISPGTPWSPSAGARGWESSR